MTVLINEECCSAVIHTRPGDTKSHAFGLTRVHNLECTSASGGVAGLMQDAGRKDCYLKTRDKETTFFFFFPNLLCFLYIWIRPQRWSLSVATMGTCSLLPPCGSPLTIATCSLLSPRPSLAFLLVKVSPEAARMCYSLGHGVDNS